MARPIDEKIVAMKMDNSDFVKKASQTTSLFGKLTDALNKVPGVNIGKVAKGFGDINREVDRVRLNPLSSAIQTVSSRFTALDVMATTALVNITNRAVNAGLALQRSLTTDQVRDGFREYETKIGSIGTILANTEWAGTTLEEVKTALNELNDYADMTIYNFGQMTASIGRFTTAGIGLEDSTIAIKGMGNLAAISGSTSAQMDSAMYQMSQMLQSGRMNLQDWNSFVNAGMAGKKVQDAFLETARGMGKSIDLSEGFRNSITDGWLTAEVFLETMKKFGEDESMIEAATKVRTFTQFMDTLKEGIGSGWAETWELIFGDFEEATRFWTFLSDNIGAFFAKGTDARNNFLRAMIEGEGFTHFINGMVNVATPVVQLFGAIGKGFKLAFPPSGISILENLAGAFNKITSGLIMSENTVAGVTKLFHGIFAIFSSVWEIAYRLGQALWSVLPDGISMTGTGILGLLTKVADLSIAFNQSLKDGTAFTTAMDILKATLAGIVVGAKFTIRLLSNLGDALAEVWNILAKGTFTGRGPWNEDSKIVNWMFKVREAITGVVDHFGSLNDSLDKSANFFERFFGGIKSGFTWIGNKVKSFGTAIGGYLGGLTGTDIMAGGFVAGMVTIFGMLAKVAWDMRKMFTGWGDIVDGAGEVLEGVSNALNSFAMSVKANALLTIAISIGVLTGALLLLSTMDGREISTSLTAVVGSMMAVVGAMAIMDKYNITGTGFRSAMQIVALGMGMIAVAGALKMLSGLDMEELAKGAIAVVVLLGGLAGAFTLMSRYGRVQIGASSLQIIALAGALLMMSNALEDIATLNPADITKGLLTMLGIMATLTGAIVAMSRFGKAPMGATSLQLLALAGSIHLMVSAIDKISNIDGDAIWKGLGVITAILAAVAGFSILTKGATAFLSGGGIILIAIGLMALVAPLQMLGSMDTGKLVKGLLAMAGAFAIIAATSSLMSTSILAGAGILVLSAALTALLVPIATLGSMKWSTILKGLGAMAAVMIAVGIASLAIAPSIVPMLGFSVALLAMSGAMALAGVGMTLFSSGLLALAGMSAAAITTVVATLGTLIIGLTSLIPTAVEFAEQLFLQITDAIIRNSPQAVEAGVLLMTGLLNGLIAVSPTLMEAAVVVIGDLLDAIVRLTPKIVQTGIFLITRLIEAMGGLFPRLIDIGVKIVANMLEGVTRMVPTVVDAGLNIIQSFIQTFADNVPDFVTAGANIVIGFIEGLSHNIPRIVYAATLLVVEVIEGMAHAIQDNGPLLTSAMIQLMGSILYVVVDAGLQMVDALFGWIPGVETATATIAAVAEDYIARHFGAERLGTDKGIEFAEGMSSQSGTVNSAGVDLANAGVDGIVTIKLDTAGQDFAQGFANGMTSKVKTVKIAARTMASTASNAIKDFLDIRSPSRLTHQLGSFSGEGFAGGITSSTANVTKSSKSIAGIIMDALGIKSKTTPKAATAGGKKAADSYAKGVSSTASKKKVATSAKSVADTAMDAFNKKMDELEYKFEMGQINTNQFISQVEKLKKTYSKYPEIVRKANLKIKQLEEQEARRKDQARRDQFNKEKQQINDRKHFNQLAMTQELKSWQQLQAKYKQGTDERKEADREVYRLKNEINKQLIELNDEYTSKMMEANERLKESEKELNDQYNQAVKDRAKELSGFAGLFDKVTKDTELSGQELMDNLKSQVTVFEEWTHDMDQLEKRGIDRDLLGDLREMGPQSAEQIAALVKLSDQELSEYSKMYRKKMSLARVEAVEELEGMRKDTTKQITELRKETANELELYKREWLSKIKEIKNGTTEGMVGLNTSMTTIGKNAISGMIKGLNDMAPTLKKQAQAIANSVSSTIKSTLQIKSPSRVTQGLGRFAGEGLAAGLLSTTKDVSDSAKGLALTARDQLNSFLEGFEMDTGDNELHFKAVIDYDSFDPNGFGNVGRATIVPDTSLTSGLVSETKSNLRQNDYQDTGGDTDNSSTNTTNNYNIHIEDKGYKSRGEIRKLAEQVQTEIKNLNDRNKISRGEAVIF